MALDEDILCLEAAATMTGIMVSFFVSDQTQG